MKWMKIKLLKRFNKTWLFGHAWQCDGVQTQPPPSLTSAPDRPMKNYKETTIILPDLQVLKLQFYTEHLTLSKACKGSVKEAQ